jgi:hypothetical protein
MESLATVFTSLVLQFPQRQLSTMSSNRAFAIRAPYTGLGDVGKYLIENPEAYHVMQRVRHP